MPDAAGEDTLAGMRGPFLQALPIANWSGTDWMDFAKSQSLHPNVIKAFDQEGFGRLYDFQERSTKAILKGDDTVISAATGRGKTEAWLIPILDQIVKAKRNENTQGRTSTKALLFYPTKALGQDQFKRLVQIIYRINRNLRKKEWVTIGIYDGDTPRHIYEDNAQGYLNRTFEHFGCPGRNDELDKCQSCGKGVFVERSSGDFRLRPDKPECEDDEPHHVPLDFVRLTRSSITDQGADIVLTNPDTVNYRLFNINAETEQAIFVYEPEFLVLDEVHTYDGLLGSYTSTLIKRIRRLRENVECDPLKTIGSSATVENDTELFRQISGAEPVTAVREDPKDLGRYVDETVPPALTESQVSEDDLIAAGRGVQDTPPQIGDADLQIDESDELDNDRLRERLSGDLFDSLTRTGPEDGVVRILQSLHSELRDEPRSPTEFRDWVAEEFSLNEDEAEILLDNFQTIGQFSGLLESRHHLFSWPLDGFYACVECSAVYRSPQDACESCGTRFVTRATYCKNCDEEYHITNACSRCDQLVPYVHTEEGLIGEEEQRSCPYCLAESDERVPMHEVVFQPTLECEECENHFDRSMTGTCGECGSPGVPRPNGDFICRNPDCEATWSNNLACPDCGGDGRSIANTSGRVACDSCGRTYQHDSIPVECECGATVSNTRFVLWACGNDSCNRRHRESAPPDVCDCGYDGAFVKAGLYDLAESVKCHSCGRESVPGTDCSCTDPDGVRRHNPHRRYKTWTEEGTVKSPLNYSNSIPCDHDLWSTVVGDAFTQIMRSPTNVSVTTSQYLLRDVVEEEGFESAKLLAFSDSHKDMKDLDRSFTEPEIETFIDQLVFCSIDLTQSNTGPMSLDADELHSLRPGRSISGEEVDTEWVQLSDVLNTANRLIWKLEKELGGETVRERAKLDITEVVLGTQYVDDQKAALFDRIRKQVMTHIGEWRTGGHGALATDGLVDVRLRSDIISELPSTERALVRSILDAGNGSRIDSLSAPSNIDKDSTIERLCDRDILVRDRSRVYFNPSAIEVALQEIGQVEYDPVDDEYVTSLQRQFGFEGETVACSDSLLARADPSHPRFSERAFTATNSRLALLLSQLYYGSTPKMERREIEHQFRESKHPNFLSSGPTMELGVDIGSLDALLLNGTPPNMNAYLQRVGRAGRSSHSSLVHSVSQRNPIDYYYYEAPTDLITADKQPVPLNEHNERVLRISMAWAVLDYVAATFTIPWKVTRHNVSGGEEADYRENTSADIRAESGKFSQLLARSVGELDLGSESSRLRPLGIIIEDYEDDIRKYLASILSYTYCTECHRRYESDEHANAKSCPQDDCDGLLIDAHEEYGHLIDDAITAVHDIFIDGYRRHVSKIQDRIDEHEDRLEEIDRLLDDLSGDDHPELESERTQYSRRIQVLESHIDDLDQESYLSVMEQAYGEYAFNLRTVSDSVEISVVDESGDPERVGDDRGGRSSRLALSELHPYAAYLHDRRPHIVSQVVTDDKGSEDLRELLEANAEDREDARSHLAVEYLCPECGDASADPAMDCDCDSDVNRIERRMFALDSVEATLDTEPLPNEKDRAGTVYEDSSSRVQSTFANKETEIISFDPEDRFGIVSSEGEQVGSLEHGSYEILEYADSYRAKYQSGKVDGSLTRFELCDEPDCPGVIYSDHEDTKQCSVNAEHVPDDSTDTVLARFGYAYQTEGVRLILTNREQSVTHSLGHGIRLGLQKLSGVTIRDVNEHVGAEHVDIFDAQEGGAAVARQLIKRQDDRFQNFQTALELMEQQFDCSCDDGCPRCLYQYGCAERNDPHSLDRGGARELVSQGLRLSPRH